MRLPGQEIRTPTACDLGGEVRGLAVVPIDVVNVDGRTATLACEQPARG
jgi:hypothetical protein